MRASIDHHGVELGIWGWDFGENLMGLFDFVGSDEIGEYTFPMKGAIFGIFA